MKQRCLYAIMMTKIQRERLDNNQCPTCGKPKSEWNRRTDWRCCCVGCTEKFEKTLRLFWSDIRIKAFERDNFTCVKCGKKPKKREMKSRKIGNGRFEYYWKEVNGDNSSELIGDHIKPIALGGDEWDLDNIQTLCIECNKVKTKEDMKKIAKQRRIEKKLIKGQEQITSVTTM